MLLFVIIITSAVNIYFHVENVFAEPTRGSKICIIGAGYSGLASARYMKDYALNYTVFESTSYIGGTWRFDPRNEADEFGTSLYTNQYKNLRTNSPIQTMEMTGYPFPEDSVSFPTGACFYKYLKSFAKDFDLIKNIQFRSLVKCIQWTGESWNITYTKTDTKENVVAICDFVVVASGIFNKPYIPSLDGQDKYKGRVMHSHDYKDAEDYRDQRVFLIGGGPSGMDLSIQLANITSKLVHSHHILKTYGIFNPPDVPGGYIVKPDLKYFTEHGAVFDDGTSEDFDIVIYCTGYKYYYPFLNHLSNGVTVTEDYVFPLYQQVVNINQPTMTFVGLSKKPFTTLLGIQAEYSAALAAKRFKLPSQDQMLQQWLQYMDILRQEGNKITNINSIAQDMGKYVEDLHKEAGIQRLPRVLKTIFDFNVKSALEDFSHFRDYEYDVLSDTQYKKKYNPRKEVCSFDV